MLKKTLVAALAATLALGAALSASAGETGVIDPNSLGAAVAMPYLTTAADDGDRITVASVTNGFDHKAVTLHIIWLSGTDWTAIDYDCPLTPLETTYFVHEKVADSDNALVTFECSTIGQDFPNDAQTNNVVTRIVNGADGIMFVAIECQVGQENCEPRGDGNFDLTLHDNILAADFVVMDFGAGTAFSAPAIHIQGVPEMDDPHNRRYSFDGSDGEYFRFPSLLTTNYIAPDDSVSAELLLFTLDGTVGSSGGINAKVAGFAYDDDENPTSGSITFDCMTITPIDATPNGFGLNVTRPFGGHTVGHLELFPAAVARSDEHELLSDTPEGVRRALVHGYLLQSISAGGQFVGGEFGGTMAANAVWARQLTQGTNPLIAIDRDRPALDTKVIFK